MREVNANAKAILALTKKLCAIPSVSGKREEENRACATLLQELRSITPSFGNTLSAQEILCEGDSHKRNAVFALLRSANRTKKTVLLTGHFDVVDTEGALKDLAFSPDEYTRALAKENLTEEVRIDLESGNWLFGRGTMDMKAGLALFIETMRAFAKSPDLAINIAFLAVPDEECDSAGMRGSIRPFCTILKTEDLDVIAALTGEPCFWTTGKHPTRPYYTGTTGKIMPYFLCLGKATHVNDYVQGANAMLLASHVVSLFEGNPDFIDGTGADTLSPPACLRCETRTGTYSVSLPSRAICFFNVLTDSRTPEDILTSLRTLAEKALSLSCEQMQKTAEALMTHGAQVASEKKAGRVFSYDELTLLCVKKLGSVEAFKKAQLDLLKSFAPEMDMREKAIRVSEWVADLSGVTGPAIVVGFLPPYYPHRVNRRRNQNEKILRKVIEEAASRAGALAQDQATSLQEVFGGITDLSFLGFEGNRAALTSLADNMPAWGELYSLPMTELLSLDIPVANMGPAGKDAHKPTERLELQYSLEVAPKVLSWTICELAKEHS